MGEQSEKIVGCLLAATGFVLLLLHPKKTYALLVYKVGWYDER